MADEKKRWTPGKLSFADVKPDPPPIRKFFEPHTDAKHIRFLPPQGFEHKFKDVSMGCRVKEPECPLCEAGMPTKEYTPFNFDFAQIELRLVAQMLAEKGFKLESPQGRTLVPMPNIHTHDNAVYQVPQEGDRIVGIDFGDNGQTVLVMGVVKRCGEPNKNGDVFILEDMKILPAGQPYKFEEPKYVGKFQVLDAAPFKVKGTATGRITTKKHLNRNPRKVMNKTAERIKMMTERYIDTYKGDPHHVPQTDESRFAREYLCRPLDAGDEPGPMKIPKLDEDSPIEKIRWVLQGIMERQEWLAHSPNAPKLIEARELSREQYTLYRAQQRVEALLHRKEAEMNDRQLLDLYADECQAEVDEENGKQVICPRCNDSMVLREAGRGLMEGHKFYGCSNYPNCDATRTVNEVMEEYPKTWKVRVRVVRAAHQPRLEFAVLYGRPRQPLMGKRFHRSKFAGSHVFYGFIEPAARAAGSTIKNMVRELILELGISNPSVIVERLVSEDGCDDIMLEKVLRQNSLIEKFIYPKGKPRELFRVNVEKRADGRKEEFIQLRAKDRKGQTIKTSQMPWEHIDDPYAMGELIQEFCFAVSSELCLGSGEFDGAQQVVECLRESTENTKVTSSRIKGAVEAVHQVAMSIDFMPKEDQKPKRKRIGDCVVFSIDHQDTNNEYELTYFGKDAKHSIRHSIERTVDEGVIKNWLVRFASNSAAKFGVPATTCMKRVLKEFERAHPSMVNAREKSALVMVCKKLIDNIIDLPVKKERSLQEIADRAWSQQTEKFIEEQKRLAPQREQERRERLHKAQEDARKLANRTKRYDGTYCNKCHRMGCMCPRPVDPFAPENYPLHSCKDGVHVRLGPIPLRQQNDMDLPSGDWEYCLDCFEVLDGGKPTGRRVSTLRAPQDS